MLSVDRAVDDREVSIIVTRGYRLEVRIIGGKKGVTGSHNIH